MTDHTDLPARLDAMASPECTLGVGHYWTICEQAAAAIREQAAEIERLTADDKMHQDAQQGMFNAAMDRAERAESALARMTAERDANYRAWKNAEGDLAKAHQRIEWKEQG